MVKPALAIVGACAVALVIWPGSAARAAASSGISTVAVFPVENLSGGPVPGAEIRQFLVDSLVSGGVRVLSDEVLEDFITRHRIRYAAGVDGATAELLRTEAGADGVVIASVELANGEIPPRLALTARLVSLRATPDVVWADDVGLSGDEAPGWLSLGLVTDYVELETRALERLARSLLEYLATGEWDSDVKRARKFRPKSVFRSWVPESAKTYTVAVLPFHNVSGRRNAGEIVSLLFVRHVANLPPFRVVDVGVTRQELLNARVIMEGGVSISDAETLALLTEADFVLAGQVLAYQEVGPTGLPQVEFSSVLIERASRRVVWSSRSDNVGSDGVYFFGRGTSRTAHAMATQMVRLAAERMAETDR